MYMSIVVIILFLPWHGNGGGDRVIGTADNLTELEVYVSLHPWRKYFS